MANPIRRLVSQNKVRFNDKEYDLDLAYINRRIIAMGFPATGFSSSFRNPQKAVAEFFDANHPGHYKIFNLAEEPYHQSLFTGPVENFPFPDHHAPPFPRFLEILKSAHEWLGKDKDNVVAVHCIAGMGRTGTIISCLLIIEGIQPTAELALCHFANIRTGTDKGVSNPSQIRYVYYFFDHYRRCNELGLELYTPPPKPPRKIEKIVLSHVCDKESKTIFVTILNSEWDVIFNSAWIHPPTTHLNEDIIIFPNLEVAGDFTFSINEVKKAFLNANTKEIGYFTLNTFYVKDKIVHVPKHLIDGFYKDSSHQKYSPDITFTIQFEPISVDGVLVDTEVTLSM